MKAYLVDYQATFIVDAIRSFAVAKTIGDYVILEGETMMRRKANFFETWEDAASAYWYQRIRSKLAASGTFTEAANEAMWIGKWLDKHRPAQETKP